MTKKSLIIAFLTTVFIGILILFFGIINSRKGENAIYNSISDIKHPTLADYRKIQDFISHGKLPPSFFSWKI